MTSDVYSPVEIFHLHEKATEAGPGISQVSVSAAAVCTALTPQAAPATTGGLQDPPL